MDAAGKLVYCVNKHRKNEKENNKLHRGFSFERNCVLRRWESETLRWIIIHTVDKYRKSHDFEYNLEINRHE